MKVSELITILQGYSPRADVVATWEGCTQPIDVYQSADGRVMIDADNNFYKARWQRGAHWSPNESNTPRNP